MQLGPGLRAYGPKFGTGIEAKSQIVPPSNRRRVRQLAPCACLHAEQQGVMPLWWNKEKKRDREFQHNGQLV